jgi:hypothetical protein
MVYSYLQMVEYVSVGCRPRCPIPLANFIYCFELRQKYRYNGVTHILLFRRRCGLHINRLVRGSTVLPILATGL